MHIKDKGERGYIGERGVYTSDNRQDTLMQASIYTSY